MSSGKKFSISMVIHGKKTGASAVQRTAYRFGMNLYDEQIGKTHYYAGREDVLSQNIYLPPDTPESLKLFDPEVLSNAIQQRETKANARLLRELRVALPYELEEEGCEEVMDKFCDWLCRVYEVPVLSAFHDRKFFDEEALSRLKNQYTRLVRPGVWTNDNLHFHILLATRKMEEGKLTAKTRILDDKKTGPGQIEMIRQACAECINWGLKKRKKEVRVDHRSYERQGIDQIPQLRLNLKEIWAHKRGIKMRKGEFNAELARIYHEKHQINLAINRELMLRDKKIFQQSIAEDFKNRGEKIHEKNELILPIITHEKKPEATTAPAKKISLDFKV